MKLKNKAKNPTHAIFGIATDGEIINAPISTFPHALIAGATNSGKSVFINSALISMMAVSHPDEVKLIIIDPKGNEFGNYKGLPHMLTNPIIDLTQCKNALEYLANVMDYRLQLFQKYGGKKTIEAFNNAIDKGEITGVDKLPYIILTIDELADLMSQYKDDVEGSIKRLGAKARAAGVHMLLATQTPRREYIDGAIKANVPTKFVLMVSGYTESMVSLGKPGAEDLKPHGDFYASIGGGKIQRGQAPLVEDDEIKDIFDELRATYPEPELIDIDKAVVEMELNYKRMVAENTGKNPDDISMEDISNDDEKKEEPKKTFIQSERTEEEREEGKKQHEEAMKKIEQNEKEGKNGSKTVSLDTSNFSFNAINKRRKEKGEAERKPKSGIIPTSSSRRKKKQEEKLKAQPKEEITTNSESKSIERKTTEPSESKASDVDTNNKKEPKKKNTTSMKENRQYKEKSNVVSNRRRGSNKVKKRKTTTNPLARKR